MNSIVVKHKNHVDNIIRLITRYKSTQGLSETLKKNLDSAITELRDGNEEIHIVEDNRKFLNGIVDAAKSQGLGGGGTRILNDVIQEDMKAAALLYYDNLNEWKEDLFILDGSSVKAIRRR